MKTVMRHFCMIIIACLLVLFADNNVKADYSSVTVDHTETQDFWVHNKNFSKEEADDCWSGITFYNSYPGKVNVVAEMVSDPGPFKIVWFENVLPASENYITSRTTVYFQLDETSQYAKQSKEYNTVYRFSFYDENGAELSSPIEIKLKVEIVDYTSDNVDENIYNIVYEGIRNHMGRDLTKTYIDLSKYSIFLSYSEEMVRSSTSYFWYPVLLDHPEFFNVETCDPDVKEKNGYYYLKGLTVNYRTDFDFDAFYAEEEKAFSVIKQGMTDLEKAIAIHDYLVSYTDYSQSTTNHYNIYGPIVEKHGNCEGYAATYKYYMDKLGIENYLVHSDSLSHIWNMVVIDGQAYHVDVAFDSPDFNPYYSVDHTNCLVSDAVMKETHATDFEVLKYNKPISLKASSTKYDNACWKHSYSPFLYYNNEVYFGLFNTDIGKYQIASLDRSDLGAQPTVLVEDAGKWGGDSISSVLLTIKNGKLFYNTNNGFDSVALDGTNLTHEYEVSTGDKKIYSAYEKDGRIYYILQDILWANGDESHILLSESDRVNQSGWYKLDGAWRYKDASCKLAKGWQKIANKWYYFDTTGAMKTGWQKISGKWYYLGTDGAMVKGWKQISGKWYYFDGGAMVTGTKTIAGKTYTFDSNGVWIK